MKRCKGKVKTFNGHDYPHILTEYVKDNDTSWVCLVEECSEYGRVE